MNLELLLSDVTRYLMLPVLLVLVGMFAYALLALGGFVHELLTRRLKQRYGSGISRLAARAGITQSELELQLLKELERPRIVSRVAPMLGLVATMIPMGPALMAVSAGDSTGMAQQLMVAFSAVIVALVSAAICYVILLVRRRWLLEEIDACLRGQAAAGLAGSKGTAA
ncbi:MAG TPA: MotA/TolQ/ExbB proton channel family protein [Hyphomicrobiales bacterium]|nr:MotA/TolQ/ExbB proton channel family protein [Hyphomicrobiales bacterium]